MMSFSKQEESFWYLDSNGRRGLGALNSVWGGRYLKLICSSARARVGALVAEEPRLEEGRLRSFVLP